MNENENKKQKSNHYDINDVNDFNNLSNSFEFNKFFKELEIKDEGIDKTKIFNEVYNLMSSKSIEIIDKMKSFPLEKMDKYFNFIKNSLKYLKDSIDIIYKLKIFYNLKSKNNNKSNDSQKDLLINEEFINYKKELIKLLNCENINIFIYDSISDSLILKGEKEELKYQKDKDLIGLSFTSGKKIRYEADNTPSIPLLNIISENNTNKINNLLIYPLKDKNDNIYGIIEAKNKIQDKENNIYNNMYFKDKNSFNKNDEILMSLISKDLGNFCKYYNSIKYNTTYISYYHTLLQFWQNLFLKKNKEEENNIFYMFNEVIALTRNIFDMNDIKFLLCKKENFYDIQNNCNAPFEGLVYKSYIEKKIIYTYNPLIDNDYSSKSDLTINILNMNKKEEIITIPIQEIINNDVIMVLQIKTNKKLGINYNNNLLPVDNYKLTDENYFIIEKISFMLQKYLSDNKELIQKL